MKKMFIVAVDDDASKEQRDRFTSYLRGTKYGFWHHIASAWIIQDTQGVVTAAQLRDKLKVLMPGVFTIVIQVRPKDYAAIAPAPSHQWLRDYVHSGKWEQ